jgi:hypothetical protein
MFTPGIFDVTIKSAKMTESEGGTPGLLLELHNDTNGTIFHTVWLTPKTRDRARTTLEDFGVKPEALSTGAFWDNPDGALAGKAASITCENEVYKEKTRLKVKWLNGPNRSKPAPPGTSKRMADLFGEHAESDPGWADDPSDPGY